MKTLTVKQTHYTWFEKAQVTTRVYEGTDEEGISYFFTKDFLPHLLLTQDTLQKIFQESPHTFVEALAILIDDGSHEQKRIGYTPGISVDYTAMMSEIPKEQIPPIMHRFKKCPELIMKRLKE